VTTALVLCSGGIDSVTLAHKAASEGHLGAMLFLNWNQPAAAEEWAACRFAADVLGARTVTVGAHMPGLHMMASGVGTSGARVVPGRNLIFASIAVGVALSCDCSSVWLGCIRDDHDAYPDCRPAFIRAINATSMETYGVQVAAPFVGTLKREIIAEANRLHVDIARTWSCYQGHAGAPCGSCDACVCRSRALIAAHAPACPPTPAPGSAP